MSEFHKHQHVTYDVRGRTIAAIVRRVHRDGTVTVEARFVLDGANERPGYLGYRYRFSADALRSHAVQAACHTGSQS